MHNWEYIVGKVENARINYNIGYHLQMQKPLNQWQIVEHRMFMKERERRDGDEEEGGGEAPEKNRMGDEM